MISIENANHIPVLKDRVVELLSPALRDSNSVFVDATLGLGGHSELIAQAFDCQLVGIDRDPHALQKAGERLKGFGSRIHLVNTTYDQIDFALSQSGLAKADAILFDLGVSSMQLDVAERGFSYAQDAPLDMRMNPDDLLSAAEVVNTYSESELTRVLRVYGEEKFAARIARNIIQARPLERTSELVAIINESIPAPARRTGGNPAKRTFQALRIEVNDELNVLERALSAALDVLSVGGRIVVLSYHSGEDRITKNAFAEATTSKAPVGLPFEPAEMSAKFALVTRGSEKAHPSEIATNRRAKSVRLRAIERIAA